MGRNKAANDGQRGLARSTLLCAGHELFASEGFGRTAIGSRAGCSRGVLHHSVDSGEGHPRSAAFAHPGASTEVEWRFFQTALIGIFTHRVLSPRDTPVAELVEHLIP